MELTHRFTVPTPVEETWRHFQDIASVAECFPGAQVTSAEGDSFSGTCKVKLGPIALVYTGSGRFVERDEAAHTFVVEAKGRDKRGNGTAGARVTLEMAGEGDGTAVDVRTDLAITGKPAQFGRGVMQDVSDKLLGQFVACLEQRLGTTDGMNGPSDPDSGPASVPTGAAAEGTQGDTDSGPASAPGPAQSDKDATGEEDDEADRPPTAAPAQERVEALDLGTTVLPVLLRAYGRQAAAALLALAVLAWLLRRRR